ncbi:MAG: hypothetical protein JXX28_03855 [Deltaproteobacteria bacterium]|nr:hypothetical protein [Deltaproteobacteria bacterium]
MKSARALIVGILALGLATDASAGAGVGGYFRVAARPDLQGGQGSLGYWNLYGRLMNEGSYGMVDLRVGLVEPRPGTHDSWTSVHARVEGGSIAGADGGGGSLADWKLSEFYVKAGNVLIPGVEWRVGTLYYYQGDLGLYDFRPSNLFHESVGVSGRIDNEHLELILGIGDAGFAMRPDGYNTILTPGGALRLRFGRLELGGGGQAYIEPKVTGKPTAPHVTPGMNYEDWVRGEVVQRYLEENPGLESQFTAPEPTSALSWRVFGYLGFGGVGPIIWSNTWVNRVLLHPDARSVEVVNGRSYDLFVTELTDERYQLNIGHETQLRVVPDRLDAVWGWVYGDYSDKDNDVAPSDHDRLFYSTVLRGQLYMTETVHLLAEGSVAREVSRNGNAYRDHQDSIFKSADGISDTDGLEWGDDDTRDTWQAKGGVVLNPLGRGVFTRPSLRLLYGVQHSTQNNAFGNAFVDSLDAQNDFGNVERHWHHLASLETEVWF